MTPRAIIGLLAVLLSSSVSVLAQSSNDYSYFLLEMQYANTICADGTFACKSSWTCVEGPSASHSHGFFFTLHGLWPERSDGSYPQTCSNEQFDPSQVADLDVQLNKYWISLNGPSPTFWAHEWEKHGTCATDVLPTQHAFFNTTLALRARYDLTAMLAKANIFPSNTVGFTLEQFQAASRAAFDGALAAVTCDATNKVSGGVVCVGKNLTAISCPPSVTNSGKCKKADPLILPATM